ncbi:glutathione S-transferase family protein [Phreatobacter stygius]|uniref:glutathione transferase n=1 Tax=Phreatobacter stygius TaxID=1940610 RepID=A0A4D7B993_9HYPH|nr:glutathione S-transferase family protein [Phreatobacter stygius]QCI67080.1 glutathione S-transferase family protein [Phreatobacter stygius]
MAVTLHGYHYSVYLRIARMVLAEKGVAYDRVEVNPFAQDMPESYLKLHPFRRVPTLVDDGFVLYETGAITRYIDDAFAGPALQPLAARERARMAQIISMIDSYGYIPLVRQVFAQRVFGPRLGRSTDEDLIRTGIDGASRFLTALEDLAARERRADGGGPLAGGAVSLADLHLAPMVAYFTAAPEGHSLMRNYPRLSAWWAFMRNRPGLSDTDPGLPG